MSPHPHRFFFVKILVPILAVFCLTLGAQAQEIISSPHNVGGELWLIGNVTDRANQPLAGLTIELWQGDEKGNHNHPDIRMPNELRDDFQYFGTAITDADGSFAFRTMSPGAVVERPAHLHIIAHRNGEPLLITQLYFAEDHGVLLDDYIYRQRGEGYDELLFMQDIAAACYAGEATVGARVVFAQVVLDHGEGALAPTPTQPRGNFYPIVDFRGHDNDLLDADPHQERLTVNDVPEILSGRVGDGLWFIGKLFNRAGEQLEGYQIQLWQADDHGRHNHPDDDAPIELRDDFQYFGTAHTDGDGFLVFRTLKPFPYRQRPAHLHFIVKQNDDPVLVSQFFFPEDHAYVLRDRIYFTRGHGDDELLFMHDVANDCKTGEETDRLRVLMGQIVIDQDEGPRVPNPVLAPGPFQPVIDFSGYDNDLLDANPYQERLTIDDVPRIMDVAPAKVSEDTAPPAGGT